MSWKLQDKHYLWTGVPEVPEANFKLPNSTPLQGLSAVESASSLSHLFAISDVQPAGLEQESWEQADWTVRGDTLSVDLPYSQQRPTGIECYWRFQQKAMRIEIETWVSANTRLLDEQVACLVTSRLAVSQLQLIQVDADGTIENSRELSDGVHEFSTEVSTHLNQVDCEKALLCSLEGSDYHLLLAGYPGDQRSLTVELKKGQMIVQSQLNFGFLEKGVIRRARLYAALLPVAPGLTAEVEHCLQTFYHSPLPLMV